MHPSLKTIIGLSLLSLFLTGCYPGSQEAKEAEYVVIDFTRDLRKEKGMELISQRGPRWGRDNRIRDLKLHYRGFATMDRRDARRFAVEHLEDLLTRLNTNRAAHPPGLAHPLTTHDLDITFQFDTFFGQFVNPRMVHYVQIQGGHIRYFSYDCALGKNCTEVEEPYEQAFGLVQRLTEVETRLKNAPGEEKGNIIRNRRSTVQLGNPPIIGE